MTLCALRRCNNDTTFLCNSHPFVPSFTSKISLHGIPHLLHHAFHTASARIPVNSKHLSSFASFRAILPSTILHHILLLLIFCPSQHLPSGLWSSAFSNHTSFLLDPAEYWWLSVGDYPFAPVLFLNTLVFSNTPHKSTLPYTSFTPLGIMLNPKDPFAAGDPSAETIRIPIEHATLMDGTPVQPERQVIIDTNPFRYQMPKELMRRPGYGSVGEKVRLKLNSHILEGSVEKTVYQYAVSH